jgi:integrase
VPKITQRGDGRYMATLVIDGKRRCIYGKSREAVRGKLLAHGYKFVTVSNFLQQWQEHVVCTLAPKTRESYESICRVHLVPHIGDCDLQELRPAVLYDLIKKLQQKDLSSRSVYYCMSVLSRSLNWAVRWEMLDKNPVERIKLPTFSYAEVEPLTVEQAKQLLEATRGHRLETLYRFALSLGMRQGELIRLKWDDIQPRKDKEGNIYHVVVVRKAKTKAGRRVIEIPHTLYLSLLRHRLRVTVEKGHAKRWEENGLVFPSAVGTPLKGRNIWRHFKDILQKEGLPQDTRFHDLRHSCAAFLFAQSVDAHTVMRILGHSRISITMELYGHLLPGVSGSAVGKVEELLR